MTQTACTHPFGYYVDANGVISSTAVPPRGCHFEFHLRMHYEEVWIVSDSTSEVIEEYVFWDSLAELKIAIG